MPMRERERTFTATFSPFCVRAACTWAREALASGTLSNSIKIWPKNIAQVNQQFFFYDV